MRGRGQCHVRRKRDGGEGGGHGAGRHTRRAPATAANERACPAAPHAAPGAARPLQGRKPTPASTRTRTRTRSVQNLIKGIEGLKQSVPPPPLLLR